VIQGQGQEQTFSDQAVRTQVTAPHTNWILRAPAGSGKTTLLVTRYLELLSLVEKPEEILAITFTRKATAEMRERILASLKAPDSAQPAHLAQAAKRARRKSDASGWEVVANPSRLKIQTIESFRRSLVEASPIEAHIAPGTGLVQDARHCYEEAVERVFARIMRGRSDTAPVVRMLALEQFNQARVKRQIVDLLARRDQWRPAALYSFARPPQWLSEKMLKLWRTLEDDLGNDFQASDFTALASLPVSRKADGHADDALADPQAWRRIANLSLTQKGDLRKRPPANLDQHQKQCLQALLDGLAGRDTQALQAARVFPDLTPDAHEKARIDIIEACLALAQGELRALFAQRGFVDLVELGFGATRSLGTDELPTDLIIALDYSIKHVLVDEFQDTSVTQADFLHSLVREWMPGEDRSAFAVGDPMQSIYGFREAEVGLFYLAEREGMGRLIDQSQRSIVLRPAKLETNFRSHALLVDWVNKVFAQAAKREVDLATGLVSYSPAASIKREERLGSHLGASVHLFQSPQRASHELREESLFVAETARRLVQTEPNDEVAILLRNRTQAPILLSALRDQGIDYQGSELDRLADEPAVRDMLTLARAIAKPRDRLANFSLLRSPVVGLSLASLLKLARLTGSGASLAAAIKSQPFESALAPVERDAVQRCLPLLHNLRAQYQKESPRPLLERAWIMIGFAAVHGEHRARKSVEALLALIEAQGINWIDFEALDRSIADLYAPSLSDSKLIVMTIHQAKGLEFDHVLVPFISRLPRADERPSMRWHQTPEGLLAATRHGSGQDGSLYDWLAHEHKARARAETERVLYVAVTRARKSLCLTATLPDHAIELHKGRPRLTDSAAPKADALLAPIWEAVRTEAKLHLADDRAVTADAYTSERPKLERLRPGWAWQPESPLVEIKLDTAMIPMASDHSETPTPSGHEPWTPSPPIMVGNAVHEALRWLAEHSSDMAPEARIHEIEPVVRRSLMQGTSDASLEKRLLPQAIRHISRALQHKDCQWILGKRESGQSEASFSAYLSGRLVNVRVDRTFVEDGIRYIIDYKTARPRSKESRTDFRARQIAEHEGQLARYARIFNAIESRPIIAALFLTSTPELLKVPLPP